METKPPPTRPNKLEDLRGKPGKLFRLVQADLITEDEFDLLHELGFPGQEFDAENELHLEMLFGINAARERLVEQRRQYQIDLAKLYLGKHHPEVNVALVEDDILEAIAVSVNAAAVWEEGQEPVTIVDYDEEELALVTASGEVIGFANAPRSDLDRRNILEWVDERLTTAEARQAGIEAERNHWLAKISKQYDPQINKQRRIQTRLRAMYEPVGKAYLDELVANHKGKAALRSVKIGMLVLAYSKTSSRVDIVDDALAIKWAKKNCPDAVKVEETISKNLIPMPLKPTLTKDKADKTGIFWYPGGEDKFNLK